MIPYHLPYQYVIDTSALIDLKNWYPENVFPTVWERLGDMCGRKEIIAPREVLVELRKGNDELIPWANQYEDLFLEPTDSEQEILQNVLQIYPQNIIVKYSTRPWADPLVISCACHYKLQIIQHETNDPSQYKIPPVAKKFNVKCIKLIDLFSDQSWIF